MEVEAVNSEALRDGLCTFSTRRDSDAVLRPPR